MLMLYREFIVFVLLVIYVVVLLSKYVWNSIICFDFWYDLGKFLLKRKAYDG